MHNGMTQLWHNSIVDSLLRDRYDWGATVVRVTVGSSGIDGV